MSMTVLSPAARAIDSSSAHTDPLPLVPATSTPRKPSLRIVERRQQRLDALEAELHAAPLEAASAASAPA